VWLKPGTGAPLLSVLEDLRAIAGDPCAAADLIIPPGSKVRLSRPEDVRLFCKAADAPLFGEEN
jgi:hypothetical protein